MIVRGPPKGGPPPERTIGLSSVTAPRLARRPIVGNESIDSKDEVRYILTFVNVELEILGKLFSSCLQKFILFKSKPYGSSKWVRSWTKK